MTTEVDQCETRGDAHAVKRRYAKILLRWCLLDVAKSPWANVRTIVHDHESDILGLPDFGCAESDSETCMNIAKLLEKTTSQLD